MSNAIVYRLRDEHGGLLYVGVTNDLQRRMGEHSVSKTWWLEVAAVDCECFTDRPEADAYEREAIRWERPRYNVLDELARAYRPNRGRRLPEMAQIGDIAKTLIPQTKAAT